MRVKVFSSGFLSGGRGPPVGRGGGAIIDVSSGGGGKAGSGSSGSGSAATMSPRAFNLGSGRLEKRSAGTQGPCGSPSSGFNSGNLTGASHFGGVI